MKAENYNQLKAIEGLFITFRKVGAVKPSQVDLQTMARVWNEELNRIVNMYCTPCVIEMIEDLYRLLVQHEKTLPEKEYLGPETVLTTSLNELSKTPITPLSGLDTLKVTITPIEDIYKVDDTEVSKTAEEVKAPEQTTAQKAVAAIKGVFGK